MARRAWNRVGDCHMYMYTAVTAPDNNNSKCNKLRFAAPQDPEESLRLRKWQEFRQLRKEEWSFRAAY